ncbi:MAG: PTS sugar transporter subunit IIA [bacterium]
MKKEKVVYAPLTGRLFSIEDVPDPVFAQKIVGNGVAIEPSSSIAYAPIDGFVSAVVKGGHAIAIKDENGLELLIHIGIDTVKLKGEGFNCLVKEGDEVEMGEKIIEFDIEKISEKGLPLISPIVVLTANCQLHFLAPPGSFVQAVDTPIFKISFLN